MTERSEETCEKAPVREPGATFVDGWFTDRCQAGHRSCPTPPAMRLPDVGEGALEVVTGFVTATR